MKKLLFLCSFLASFVVCALADTYTINAKNSSIAFEVSHLKLTKVNGKFTDFSGSVDYAGGKLNAMEGKIAIASIDTAEKKRDSHLNAPDMFDAAKYPHISFKLSKFENGKIYGDLTIKDTTKEVILDAKVSENGKNLTISANGSLKRSDFGISWNNVFKDNAVGDEVKISLELKATK